MRIAPAAVPVSVMVVVVPVGVITNHTSLGWAAWAQAGSVMPAWMLVVAPMFELFSTVLPRGVAPQGSSLTGVVRGVVNANGPASALLPVPAGALPSGCGGAIHPHVLPTGVLQVVRRADLLADRRRRRCQRQGTHDLNTRSCIDGEGDSVRSDYAPPLSAEL